MILDDFKTALDKLSHYNLSRIEVQIGENWASSNNMAIHGEMRKPSVPPSVTTVEPWITVMTETKVESFGMKEMEGLAPLKFPRR